MHVSAKADYGVRALLELAGSYATDPEALVKGDAIAEAQRIPVKFLEGILRQLRLTGLVVAQRGAEGGYRLARDPAGITLADIIRALDGPLAEVRGLKPEDMHYEGTSEHLSEVWVAVRAALRHVLVRVSLRDVLDGKLPRDIRATLSNPDAWTRR
jgi:hypothetical protein